MNDGPNVVQRCIRLVALLLIAAAADASCLVPSLDGPPSYSAGPAPYVMAFANINGDEWTDVIVGNFTDANDRGGLAVLNGKPGGRFDPLVLYLGDASIEAVTAADFDHDGDDDVVVLDNTHSKLIVLRNDRGTLVPFAEFPGYSRNLDLVKGDFNGDGRADFAVVPNSDSISLFYGRGDLTFTQTTVPSEIGVLFPRVIVRDFDRDGKDDIVISKEEGHDITTLFGASNGFTPVTYSFTQLTKIESAYALAAGDFDGDGKLDLLITFVNTAADANGALIHNVGARLIAMTTTTHVAGSYGAPAVADFDRDGIDDLAYASDRGVQIGGIDYMLFGGYAWSMAAADLDRDGRADVVALTAGGVTVLTNDGAGGFRSPKYVAWPRAIADFNGDGRDDILSDTRAWISHAGGTFSAAAEIPHRNQYGDLYDVAVADLNHDGKPDFVYFDEPVQDLVLTIGLGNGDGTFRVIAETLNGLRTHGQQPRLVDVDGDGALDLVASLSISGDPLDDDAIAVARGNGDGTFGPFIKEFSTSPFEAVQTGDFNGDGKPDLFLDDATIRLNDGHGNYPLALPAPGFGDAYAAGDVNGDGRDDLIVGQRDFGFYFPASVTIFISRGDGTFAPGPTILTGLESDIGRIVVRDFNGDGFNDIVVLEDTDISNRTGEIIFLSGDGKGNFNAPVMIRTTGIGPIGIGDFNCDGVVDLDDAGFVRLGTCTPPPQHRRATTCVKCS